MAVAEWITMDDPRVGNGTEGSNQTARSGWVRHTHAGSWVVPTAVVRRGLEDELYEVLLSYVGESPIGQGDLRTRATNAMPQQSQPSSTATHLFNPFFRRGMVFVTLLLAISAASLAFFPVAGVFGAGLCLTAWGVVVLIDTARNGRSLQDPRVGVLSLIAGIGTLAVLVTRAVTG